MADSTEEALCDLVGDLLDDSAGLPDHSTILYDRPRFVFPDDCPLLVVWIENELQAGVETERVNYDGVLGISWHQEAVTSVTDLLDDPVRAKSLLRNMRKIKDRLHWLAYHGDFPEPVNDLYPQAIEFFTSPYDDGETNGYAMTLIFKMNDVPPDA